MMFVPRNYVLGLLLTVALTRGEIRNRGWWNHTIFYQVYPRSFMDADNDGVGDFRGITSKLQHFVDSGVGAIWLSTINSNPMAHFGYDVVDFKDIHATFGTLQDFKRLLERAKEIGLKVIFDLVPNHTSDQHAWFNSSVHRQGKYTDYYIWMNGSMQNRPPNNWLSVYGGSAWKLNDIRGQWYLHQFNESQPDLNYTNPEVQEEMREVFEYWLRKGVDGFRLCAVPHLFETNFTSDEPKSDRKDVNHNDYNYLNHVFTKDRPQTYELVQNWTAILNKFAALHNTDEKVMMTEANTSLENTIKYYNYGSHVPLNFNFITNVSINSTATEFKNIIDRWIGAKPPSGVSNWMTGDHDHSRIATRFGDRGNQMTMLAMILPGVAVTYYGEEIGMIDNKNISCKDFVSCEAGAENYKFRPQDPFRTPFQWNAEQNAGFSKAAKTWLPIDDSYRNKNLNLEIEQNLIQSAYQVYHGLTKLRNASDALKFGSLTTDVLNKTVLMVLRKTRSEAVTLLINFSNNDTQTVDLTKTYLKEFKTGVIKVKSILKLNQNVQLKKIYLPKGASMVILSKPEPPNSKAPKYVASLQTILLPMFFLTIMSYQ